MISPSMHRMTSYLPAENGNVTVRSCSDRAKRMQVPHNFLLKKKFILPLIAASSFKVAAFTCLAVSGDAPPASFGVALLQCYRQCSSDAGLGNPAEFSHRSVMHDIKLIAVA